MPLKLKLDELVAINLAAQLGTCALQRTRLAQRQLTVPERPHDIVVGFLQRHKQRKLVEPPGALVAERCEGVLLCGRTPLERLIGLAQQWHLPCDDRAKVHVAGRKLGPFVQIASVEISIFGKSIEADQQRIAGKCGETLVRRIAVTGWTERKDLPDIAVPNRAGNPQSGAPQDPVRQCRRVPEGTWDARGRRWIEEISRAAVNLLRSHIATSFSPTSATSTRSAPGSTTRCMSTAAIAMNTPPAITAASRLLFSR